eukprot:11357338-Alexandrium_andersonii.AAC.1
MGAVMELRQVWCSDFVDLGTKLSLLETMVVTRSHYNVACWTRECSQACAMLARPVYSVYRRICAKSHPHLRGESGGTQAAALAAPHPATFLHLARLRFLARIAASAP